MLSKKQIEYKFKIILVLFFSIVFSLDYIYSQLLPILENDNIGYIDSTGKVIIPCEFVSDIEYSKINIMGNDIIDFFLPNWTEFHNGAATVKIAKKWLFLPNGFRYGLINSNGKYIYPIGEDFVYSLSEGVAIYKKLYKTAEYAYDFEYGYIDSTSKIIISPQFQYASKFSDGFALVLDSSKYSFIDKSGKKIINYEFIDATLFENGIAAIKKTTDEPYGYINKKGEYLFSERFEYAYNFKENRARVFDGKYYGFINTSGKYISLPEFTKAEDFSENLAVVQKNFKYGFIDTNSKIIIPMIYQYAASFSEGLAVVAINNKYGFINKTGEVVISNKYDYAKSFTYGLAQVWKNGEVFYINNRGERVYTIFNKHQYKKLFDKFKKTRN